jgi:hypothetical protein
MRISIKPIMALVAVCLLSASASGATTFDLQAASGHPHLTFGTTALFNESPPVMSGWVITDGRTIGFPPNGAWDTPIPLTSTNTTWSALGFGNGGSTETCWTNRICTFDFVGNFFSCGASVTNFAASTATVPLQGSAYSQTSSSCSSSTSPTMLTLFHIIAHD